MAKLVYNVGQCGFDHGNISAVLSKLNAEVRNIQTESELLAQIQKQAPSLILVNRVLDGDGSSGHEIIRNLKSDDISKSIPVMLVSNYSAAQGEAVDLGALPGFGKDNLHSADTAAALKKILS